MEKIFLCRRLMVLLALMGFWLGRAAAGVLEKGL